MQITFVTEYFPLSEQGELRGGAEARLFFLSRELAYRHHIRVAAVREPGFPSRHTLFGGNLEVFRFGRERGFEQAGSLLARGSFILTTTKWLRRNTGEILDAQNFLAYLAAWGGRSGFRRNVCTIHDVWAGRWRLLFGVKGYIGEMYERFILTRNWDLFIVNSKKTSDRLQTVRRALRTPTEVIYNGIREEVIRETVPEPPPVPTICYVGRLVEYKRVQDVLHALPAIQRRVPDVRLKIIGVGPYEDVLRSEVHRMGLDQSVHFLGQIKSHDDVLKEIRTSTILSLPSIIEGFGMVTVEAMACGIPFVNADIAISREVTGSKGGVFFQPKDIRDLEKQILRLLTDRELAARLGQDGKIRAHDFLWEKLADQTERTYLRLLEPES